MIFYILAVSSISTYGILLAGLNISPAILVIIDNKFSEFQEIIKRIILEAKHIFFNVRSTISGILYKNNNFTISAKGFIFYLFFGYNNFFIIKKICTNF